MCFASRRSMQCSDGQQLMRKLRFPKATAVPIGEFIEVFLEFGDTVKRAEKTSFEIRDGGGGGAYAPWGAIDPRHAVAWCTEHPHHGHRLARTHRFAGCSGCTGGLRAGQR